MSRVFAGVDTPIAYLYIWGRILPCAVSCRCGKGASHLHELVLMYLLFQLVATPCGWIVCSTGGGMTRTHFHLPDDIALLRVTPLKFAADTGTPSSSGSPPASLCCDLSWGFLPNPNRVLQKG